MKSSPFMRSLQTCVDISKEIGKKDIEIDYTYCERMGIDLFNNVPTNDIALNKFSPKELDQKFELRGINIKNDPDGVNLFEQYWPEA